MASTPTSPSPTPGFQPAFKRVEQSNDHDSAFACIATLTGKTLAEVRQIAIEKFQHPAHGAYLVTDELISKTLGHYGLVSTFYKEMTGPISEFPPDVALLMIDYNNPDTDMGRLVVFHRARTAGSKGVVEYVIDTAYWIDTSMHVRTDLKALQPSWWIGVHQSKPAGK